MRICTLLSGGILKLALLANKLLSVFTVSKEFLSEISVTDAIFDKLCSFTLIFIVFSTAHSLIRFITCVLGVVFLWHIIEENVDLSYMLSLHETDLLDGEESFGLCKVTLLHRHAVVTRVLAGTTRLSSIVHILKGKLECLRLICRFITIGQD